MMRFILFDDDSTFAAMLGRALGRKSIDLSHFDSLRKFAESGTLGEDDIFLVDLSMEDPESVTWDFAGILNVRKIREVCGPDRQIWVLTGHRNHAIERECFLAGADQVFYKKNSIVETAKDLAYELKSGGPERRVRMSG